MSDRYGCHNRAPFPALIPLPAYIPIGYEGYVINSEAHQMIPFVFSKDCEYSKGYLSKADTGCDKCKRRSNG